MLNFRKLKQDFSSSIIKEGRDLFDGQKVVSAKIVHFDSKTLKISGRILGQYENTYESEIEIDRQECEAIDSNCDCPYNYDCHHLAALLFYLEQNIDGILVAYSKDSTMKEITAKSKFNDEEKKEFLEKVKKAESKEVIRQEELYQKQVLQEYVAASELLAISPFFRPPSKTDVDRAELGLIFALPQGQDREMKAPVELQVLLRLPYRSKPLYVLQVKEFIEALRYGEPIALGGKRYHFSVDSFDPIQRNVVKTVIEHAYFIENVVNERSQRIFQLDVELFGCLLAQAHEEATVRLTEVGFPTSEEELPTLFGFYEGNVETPLRFSPHLATLRFGLEYIKPPTSKLLLKPAIIADQKPVEIATARLFECAMPGMITNNTFYRFAPHLSRVHLRNLRPLRDLTLPEPLLGTFVENALPELSRFAEIADEEVIEQFITLPYVKPVEATCELTYLDGELDAELIFHYDKHRIPAAASQLSYDQVSSFVSGRGILARNLVEERKIIEDLFQDFVFNPAQGVFTSKSEKKIVEFMTDIIPRYKGKVHFNCPQNLLDQFIYDKTKFKLHMKHTDRIDTYEIELKVDGALKGVKLDLLWECFACRRAFVELDMAKAKGKKVGEGSKMSKILVLDLDRIGGVIQAFDELGITSLDDHKLQRPIWSLANIDATNFASLPVEFSITDQLVDIRKQMIGEKNFTFSEIPSDVKASLRSYQQEGVRWIERLRLMYLNGILADDMGLGKTLQAIVAITQHKETGCGPSIIVCPTSLLYNWKEEFTKFNPKLKVAVIDGIPTVRKKLIENIRAYDVVVTSYTLLQKDIESYKPVPFAYAILDEAQHIKNRGTRNAKSVKMVQAQHRLILSGTPIENALEELWSLFDFLMPGFLSTYDRFVEKYVRLSGAEQAKNLAYLRKKVSPFILRRMKSDVLDDLPPVSELVYHCQLSDVQQELYRSYAESARSELTRLVQKEGFDKVQIHVLATLTRLKQICCHPAIFAKEKAEPGDSAKYDMLLDLLQTLVEGQHKTVIFSQYTRMLQIMQDDFQQRGIRFLYLDGSSKNRLEVVKQFNEDASIPVFLVSLKAGGTGLNLVGADTVIHYDMWWNPAVEAQATDRVHRLGQKQSVSAYKLITLGSIEEKIAEMQKRKKGLVKKVVSCDDEAISKLTWEDVLELLKT
jgi:SNF2 family DNA or RNA helicase